MTKIFKIPFATQGDRTSIPDDVQADGAVSYTQGYSYDYERDQRSDPAAKDIEREKMNALFHDITSAIGESQMHGVSKWSEEGKPYPIRCLVHHNNKIWQSLVDNNMTEPVSGALWNELKSDLTPQDIGTLGKAEIFIELNKKFDKAKVSGVKGNDNDKVPSLNLFTTEIGKLATKSDLENRVAKTQTINGVPMNTQNIAVTSHTVFNQYTLLDDKSVLNSLRSAGIYVQENATTTTKAKGYPFDKAKGILIVWPMNTQSNVSQEWLDANGTRWSRTYNHPLWSEWAKTYDSENKLTAADIGALSVETGTSFSERITNAQNTANLASKTANSAQTEAKNANENAEKRALKTTTVNGYLLSSNILLATKDIFKNMTELGSDNLSNIFAPGIYYQKSNASALWSRNYPKDGVAGVLVIYRTNQGATTANNACVQVYYSNENIVYTRVYNGSSWAGGWATQVNTATGMTNVRLGTKTRYSPPGNTVSWNWEAPAGNVLTGLVIDDTGNNSADNISGVWYRPLQYYINGSWLTAESL